MPLKKSKAKELIQNKDKLRKHIESQTAHLRPVETIKQVGPLEELKNISLRDFFGKLQLEYPEHLEPLPTLLAGMRGGGGIRQVVNAPPRHYKSWTLGVSLLWVCVTTPGTKLLYVGYSQPMVESGIQNDMLGWAEQLKIPFLKRSVDMWELQNGSIIYYRGIKASYVGLGATNIVCDDLFKSDEDAQSLLIRDQVWAYFTKAIFDRMNEPSKCNFFVLNTRYHTDDACGRIRQQFPKWSHLVLPAWKEVEQDGKKTKVPLHPKFTIEDLEEQRLAKGNAVFEAQYLQRPEGNSTGYFRLDRLRHFRVIQKQAEGEKESKRFLQQLQAGGENGNLLVPVPGSDVPLESLQLAIGSDYAYSMGTDRDNCSAICMGRDAGGNFYVLDHYTDQISIDLFVPILRLMQERWQAPLVSYIAGTEKQKLIDLKNYHNIHCEGMTAKYSKGDRARSAVNNWNQGRIFLPENLICHDGGLGPASNYDMRYLVDELVSFTGTSKDKRDDRVDAFVGAHDKLNSRGAGVSWGTHPIMYF